MLVMTDSETATGFRLAGVEVREITADKALLELAQVIESEKYGLVLIDEALLADPNKAAARQMRGRDLPVLLSMPSLGATFTAESDATAYMKRLVRSTIGFDVKLD
ncbi:MAG: V-type ATP synthase subunit F [Truepera sp.]|nr:V-type ATP synthase subunit F [Truepera sp.]